MVTRRQQARVRGRRCHLGYGGADGTALARLVASGDVPGQAHDPTWSPDGRRIAFSLATKDHSKDKEIWVVNEDGSNARRLVRLPGLGADNRGCAGVGSLDWSPDGRRIALTAHCSWLAWIYVVNTDGTNLRRLTGHPGKGFPWAVDPRWSPDGRRLVFEQTFDAKSVGPPTSEIYVMAVDSGSQVRLTRNWDSDTRPVWSPDGRRIAFVRFDECTGCPLSQPGDSEIFVINADGTGEARLTHNHVGERSPAWQSLPAP